eukprot:gene28536-36799_t
MSRRSKISLTVDNSNMILIARLYGSRDESQEPQDLIDFVSAADAPWLYDIIIDFRRFESEISRDYIAFLTNKWRDLEAGRDQQKCMALVTNDYGLKLRLAQMMDVMPSRRISFFSSMDEALDWINLCGSGSVSAAA